jgi:hypothetical protein
MGHDIEIRRGGPKGHVIEKLYISGNWSRFDHWRIHYAHGHPGKLIAQSLQEALDKYGDEDVFPNMYMGLDGWGQYKRGSDLEEGAINSSWEDRDSRPEVDHALKCMHAGHILRFLKVAKDYPNGYWYSDQVWSVTPLYGQDGKEDISDDEDSSDEEVVQNYQGREDVNEETPSYAIPFDSASSLNGLYGIKTGNGVVYSFIHPIKGHMTVKTRDDAMDSARQAADNDDSRAVSWTMLALLLPK